jgi:hypothetical protein
MLRSTLTCSVRALRGLDARPLRRADGRRGYAMPSDFDLLADESGAARVDGCVRNVLFSPHTRAAQLSSASHYIAAAAAATPHTT